MFNIFHSLFVGYKLMEFRMKVKAEGDVNMEEHKKMRASVKKEMAYLLEEAGCRSTNISATQLENLPCYSLQITSTSVDLQRLCFEGNGESPDVVTAPITPIETTNRKTPPEQGNVESTHHWVHRSVR